MCVLSELLSLERKRRSGMKGTQGTTHVDENNMREEENQGYKEPKRRRKCTHLEGMKETRAERV